MIACASSSESSALISDVNLLQPGGAELAAVQPYQVTFFGEMREKSQ